MPKPKTITEYIKTSPKQAQVKLRQIRSAIAAAAPGAKQEIKWSMPAFSYKRILVMFGAAKHHVGFYPTPSAMKKFKKELTKFKTGAGSIQFPLDKPLPTALIKKITSFRAKEVKERDAKWM